MVVGWIMGLGRWWMIRGWMEVWAMWVTKWEALPLGEEGESMGEWLIKEVGWCLAGW